MLYRSRAFIAVAADDVPAVADDPPEVADGPELAPPGLSVADIQRPFGRAPVSRPSRPLT